MPPSLCRKHKHKDREKAIPPCFHISFDWEGVMMEDEDDDFTRLITLTFLLELGLEGMIMILLMLVLSS